MGADGADRARGGVVEEEAGPLEGRERAERLADVSIELPGLGGGVELRDQPGENVDGIGVCGGAPCLDETANPARTPWLPR